jgi:hypothetical protein
VSPLKRALHHRFDEVSRSELVRLRKKTATLPPDARQVVDSLTVELVHAIAERATERFDDADGERLAPVLAQLFGVGNPDEVKQ